MNNNSHVIDLDFEDQQPIEIDSDSDPDSNIRWDIDAILDYNNDNDALKIISLIDIGCNTNCLCPKYQQAASEFLMRLYAHNKLLCAHNSTMLLHWGAEANPNAAVNLNDIHLDETAKEIIQIIMQCVDSGHKFVMFHVMQTVFINSNGVRVGHIYTVLFNRDLWRMEIMEVESNSDHGNNGSYLRIPGETFAQFMRFRINSLFIQQHIDPIDVIYAIQHTQVIDYVANKMVGFCQTLQFFWVYMRLRYPHKSNTMKAICMPSPPSFPTFSSTIISSIINFIPYMDNSATGDLIIRNLAHFLVLLSIYMLTYFHYSSCNKWPFNSLDALRKLYPVETSQVEQLHKNSFVTLLE